MNPYAPDAVNPFGDIAPVPVAKLTVDIAGKPRPFRKLGLGHMLELRGRFAGMEEAFDSGDPSAVGKLMSRNRSFTAAVVALACAPDLVDDEVLAAMEASLAHVEPIELEQAALRIITASLPGDVSSFATAQEAAAPGNRKERRAASSRTGKAKPQT